jgi:hypothetical protein
MNGRSRKWFQVLRRFFRGNDGGRSALPMNPATRRNIMYARMNDVQNAARLAMGDYRIGGLEGASAKSAGWGFVGAVAATAAALALVVIALI